MQKPDGVTDEEWEERLEEYAEAHPTDVWDTLELLRKRLNTSKVEHMHMIKKNSRFGVNCPYYLKAKHLFDQDDRADILSLLDQLRKELETLDE